MVTAPKPPDLDIPTGAPDLPISKAAPLPPIHLSTPKLHGPFRRTPGGHSHAPLRPIRPVSAAKRAEVAPVMQPIRPARPAPQAPVTQAPGPIAEHKEHRGSIETKRRQEEAQEAGHEAITKQQAKAEGLSRRALLARAAAKRQSELARMREQVGQGIGPQGRSAVARARDEAPAPGAAAQTEDAEPKLYLFDEEAKQAIPKRPQRPQPPQGPQGGQP